MAAPTTLVGQQTLFYWEESRNGTGNNVKLPVPTIGISAIDTYLTGLWKRSRPKPDFFAGAGEIALTTGLCDSEVRWRQSCDNS